MNDHPFLNQLQLPNRPPRESRRVGEQRGLR